jgi:hypothetical protein
MAQEASEPQVLVVAGCLFEVTFPEGQGPAWAWEGNQPEVTAAGEYVAEGRRHFRFRAEEPAAAAGSVSLRFRSLTEERGMTVRMVVVLVAPERQPPE